jgi:cytochrome b pre-mRNA-processing protein 3
MRNSSNLAMNHFWVAAALLALAASGSWLWQLHLSQRELQELAPSDRQAFYGRTLETLTSVCVRANGPDLGDYCREQANLIARFPECDKSCRELSRRFAPKPTR